jgi:hypothetical protein
MRVKYGKAGHDSLKGLAWRGLRGGRSGLEPAWGVESMRRRAVRDVATRAALGCRRRGTLGGRCAGPRTGLAQRPPAAPPQLPADEWRSAPLEARPMSRLSRELGAVG